MNHREYIKTHPNVTSLIAGLLAKFCFMKYYAFWAVPIIMFYLLFQCLNDRSLKSSFKIGYIFGFGYFLSSLYWVRLSFACVGLTLVGFIAVLVLVLYLSLYPATTCYLYQKFCKNSTSITHKCIFFSCLWVLFEYLRGIIFTGFPWNLIGYATYDIPYFPQIASVVGIYGVSFVFLLCVLLLINKKIVSGLSIVLIIISFGYFNQKLFNNFSDEEMYTNITIVQPSIDQISKMKQSNFMNNLNCHLSLSNLDTPQSFYSGQNSNHLIIWPEAAVNTFINADILQYISSHIISDNTYILLGADRADSKTREIYNSSVVVGKNSTVFGGYDKKHLLPFGEYIPDFLLKIGFENITKGTTNFSKGKIARRIKLPNIPDFDVIICYEIVFPGEVVEDKNNRPKWILNITNDAWFLDSDESYQHLRTSVFRAIEEGLPIIRCANNGISCVIDCNGKILKSLPTDSVGVIKSSYSEINKNVNTIYSKYGNTLILSLLIAIMIFLVVHRRFKKL